MKGVGWSVDAHQLTQELAAQVLHKAPYDQLRPNMNFHVSLKRDKKHYRPHAGYGFLTLPTKEIGQIFLSEYGVLGDQGAPLKKFHLHNRLITFTKGHRDECNSEILEKITRMPYIDPKRLKESEDRASRLQSGAIVIGAVQFGWDCRDDAFSIEWESISQRSYALKFDPDRNEIRIAMTQRGSSDIYYIAIRYNQIKFISLDHQESSIYFSLFQPPWFESEHLSANVLANLPGIVGNKQPRQRLPYLPFEDHARVAPYTSIALRLVCSGEADIDTFRDLCADAQMQGKINDWEIQTDYRGLFSAEIIDWYSDWIQELPWEVAFQVEAIIRIMFVDFREMFSLKDKISLMVDEHGNTYASQMLKHFCNRLVAYDDGEGDVEQWFDNAAIEFAKVSKTPSLAPTDGSLFQSLHITITPTTILLEGPVLEQSNRVIRSYGPSNHASFVRVNFVDEGGLAYRFDRDIDGPDFIRRRVGSFLFEGLTIAGQSFSFLAYSQSALKEHAVWFVKPFSDQVHGPVTAKTIIDSLGQFANLKFDKKLIYCPARYAARISQAFTATDASVPVELDEIQMIPDIDTNDEKYIFTDGVGKVSAMLAAEIWNELKRTRKRARKSKTHPKAFQIRFQGSKGMLSVDSKLPGRVLCLRPSMMKFEDAHSRVIEVARAFDRPTPYFLNRPLIVLLEGLGVPFETFKTYQDLAVQQARESVCSTNTAAGLLEGHGLGTSYRLPSVLLSLHKREIRDLFSNSFWKKAMDFAVYHVLRELKYHARIPIPGAWTLVGVADEHNYLQAGEVFACVRPHTGGQPIYLEGDVLVSRSPTIHPGDVQVARAIGVPPPDSPFEKEPLPNTVVFSTKGERPLPSCLGGGDLDGDLYNLLPLNEIPEFTPRSYHEPAQYISAEKKYLDRPSNMRDVAEFVLEFINSDMVGIIAINWLIIADQSPEHILDKDCLTLAQLHSDAVDYPKTGMPVKLDRIPKLKFKQKPDWNAPETINQDSSNYYKSTRALGRLFREIELPSISTAEGTTRRRHRNGRRRAREYQQESDMVVSHSIIEEIEWLVDEAIGNRRWVDEGVQATIEQIYDRYVSELRTICANHTLSHSHSSSLSEEEAFMGTIVAKTSQPRKRKDLISRLREQTDVLVRGVKEELNGDEDTPPEEAIERSSLAWEFALKKGTTFGAQSFSWLALQSVFEAVRDAEAARKEDARRRFY